LHVLLKGMGGFAYSTEDNFS